MSSIKPINIMEEAIASQKKSERRKKELSKANYTPRFSDKICPSCGKKHNDCTRECWGCKQIDDNLEHGCTWRVP